ncbi:MAG: Crp/Fnr family transcriptional regulator [Sandaracinaceae bacterium]|jgi:CRP-like cAMP-binding protein|nr:Crp/Fnr family transcriptional regulator [Sandaracinaceae bacterium]MBK7156740.1 Crp/Fnr family transcriptional regulator [Sandaracinaceae bacterium]MBK7777592.1 Crp/Fnr family transcriptional regulator [Sandaracinaceae bacterium]MBK8410001.1 Crp/Fnr family transcriptional regulator [Sandaracinaceae bacterium]MBK8591962.1 Crp/Fnr family transcriptional regulator [Sandaracinaceae bacterium]
MPALIDCPARYALPTLTEHGCARCPLIPVRVEKGQRLPRLLDQPGALSFVAQGTVTRARHMRDAPAMVFDVVPAGEAFAQRRAHAQDGWSDECQAMGPTQVCFAPQALLADALVQHPPSVMRTLAVYERIADRVAEWATLRAIASARERLAATLQLLGGQRPVWASLGVLGEITGLRRETVCRALRQSPRSHHAETAPSAAPLRPTA